MPLKGTLAIQQKITGVLLRQARMDAGKTLKECSQVLGVSSGALSAIEHGRRSISLPELELLAFYFGVPVDHLLNGSAAPARRSTDELPGAELIALRHRIIGALVRQSRLDLDLSQAELAKQLGVSKRRLEQYETGERPIPLEELKLLAETLDIPMGGFLDEGVGPVGEQQRLDREFQRFSELSPDMRSFVLEPTNSAYLQLAMSLSVVPAEKLRNIAASLLEITL
jgi:transcriptional regulator with XRE-family HTH domain